MGYSGDQLPRERKLDRDGKLIDPEEVLIDRLLLMFAGKPKSDPLPLPSPFVKWAGGKARMWKYLEPYFRNIDWDKKRYIEPFVGGGAVLFNLLALLVKNGKTDLSKNFLINDFNHELMAAYKVIQNKETLEELIKLVQNHYDSHITTRIDTVKRKENGIEVAREEEFYVAEESFYNKVRDMDMLNKSDAEIAARFIYLNKTGFNGMYRVNSKGKFNIPRGKFQIKPRIIDGKNLLACHTRLEGVDIRCGDYYDLKSEINKNDIIYLDPPYEPISLTSSFTQYTKLDFNYKDQEKLKEFCDHINKKGAKFIQNNSDHPGLRKLYKNYKIDDSPEISRSIGASSKTRIKVKELIITNI